MRLPNGFGSVYKLSGKRRKPWIARKTTGWELDGDKARQRYITIGYYASRQEALTALATYNEDPYKEGKNITFAQMYDMWYDQHLEGLSQSSHAVWKSAYSHSASLHDMKFADIRTGHLEQAIAGADVGVTTKRNMKVLYGMLYKYAIKHEFTEKNYAALCDNIKGEDKKIVRKPYSPEEIERLWDNAGLPFVDAILIGIYSGWRPGELIAMNKSDIDLKDWTMFGGSKTAAGKNRFVPIHPRIRGLIEARINGKGKSLIPETPTYKIFRRRFIKANTSLDMTHNPHEMRHTFVTRAKEAGVDEHVLKIIVGHSVQDITEKVYTHRKIEQMHEEIQKIC